MCLHRTAKAAYLRSWPRFGHCVPLNSPESPREPILTIPFGMTAIVVIMAAIHGVRALLPLATDQEVIWTFGFVPARYDASVLAGQFPGGVGAEIWTFLTYAFLHADITHIAFNMLWMLPFGSAVARRFGTVRFFAFFAVTAIVVSLPLRKEGNRMWAFLLGMGSGAVEPLAAALTIALSSFIVPLLPYLLGFAAGAMVYVVIEELIPQMSKGKHSNVGVILFAVGFTLMMALDVAFG